MGEPIGRRKEREALFDALLRAESGQRTVVQLRGNAGIGKSTLLADLRVRAEARGHVVLRGGLSEAERNLAWAGLATLLRDVPATMLDVVPEAQRVAVRSALGDDSTASEALLVAVGLGGIIRALSERRPVTVLVDDVHWLDEATAGALAFAVRALDGARVLVVFAGRPLALPLEPGRLVTDDLFVELPLEGLSVAALRALLDDRCGVRLGQIDLVRLHSATMGNPLHVVEAGRLLAAGHSTDTALMPPSLHTALARHLRQVPAVHLPVLRAAALSSNPTVELLERVFTPEDVDAALSAAEDAEVARVRRGSIEFHHPMMITVLLDRMRPADRRQMEALLAEATENDEERALHRAAAASGPDEHAARAMEDATMAAARRGAPHLAATRAERAVELTPATRMADLLRRRRILADRLLQAGEPQRSVAIYESLTAEVTDPDERWEVHIGLAVSTSWTKGDRAEAARIAELLEAAAGDDLGRRLQALYTLARLRLFFDIAGAASTAERLLDAAAASDNPIDRLTAATTAAVTRVLRGLPVDVDALLAEAAAVLGRHEAAVALSEVLVWTDRMDIVIEPLERAVAEAETRGQVIELLNSLDQLSDAYLRSARWDDAEQLMERLCDASLAADEATSIGPRLGDLAYVDAVRGRFDDVARRRPMDHRRDGSIVEDGQIAARLGFVAMVCGDTPTAVAELRRAHELITGVGMLDLGALPFRCDLVESLLRADALEEAARVATQLRDWAAQSGRPRARVESGRATALVLAAQGNTAGAEAAWVAAMAAHDEVDLPFERARTLMAGGVVARRSGRRADARNRLTVARDEFRRLGAVPFVAKAEEELARCGMDGAVATTSGALTPTERQIAALVREGCTNAEIAAALFVSVRTVESNLTKLYRKLGVRSRTELLLRLGEA